ncbi:uncharacterized protein [Misgurnus anguillicaudatus]|uniref:uncharacterized protein isoform X1 n=2 Tax=Misgurnus anguillicaudatus TaxID=75329 RepID=UPI003CCF1546
MGASESQTKLKMLEQDRPMNPVFGGHGLSSQRICSNAPKRGEKDGNFNFVGQDSDTMIGDENRNQVRPRALGLLGRDSTLTANHFGPGTLSPLSRLPCWSPLEPLLEIESGDDMGGRVPPDGAEEGRLDEEMRVTDNDKEQKLVEIDKAEELLDDEEEEEIDWADSEEEFEFSYRSESSSPLSTGSNDIAGGGAHDPIWDQSSNATTLKEKDRFRVERRRESAEGADPLEDAPSDSDTHPDSELPDLMEAVWTLQDRERFKAQEMEKHQVQLTMYRRLALIRWVRTLQNRVQEQQNRLQSSFDIILTHRKELLRMGSATAAQ